MINLSFSTLYRVEGCAACSGGSWVDFYHHRFSTLYRVEGCAAWLRGGVVSLVKYLFQYPLSGRRLCSLGNAAIVGNA